jgi:hypothetical protein
MSTPQNPARRRKQKARRTKQLAAWREKNPTKKTTNKDAKAPKETKAAKKT